MENKQRLRKSSDFELISKKGRGLRLENWLVVAYLPNEFNHLRLGTTISKKVGNAVLRNKLKRWVRTYFRQNEVSFHREYDLNFIFKPNKELYQIMDYKTFSEKLSVVIEKLKKNK